MTNLTTSYFLLASDFLKNVFSGKINSFRSMGISSFSGGVAFVLLLGLLV